MLFPEIKGGAEVVYADCRFLFIPPAVAKRFYTGPRYHSGNTGLVPVRVIERAFEAFGRTIVVTATGDSVTVSAMGDVP